MPVVGFISPKYDADLAAFRRGLNETGYTEGTNVTIDIRWLEGKSGRVPAIVADLVARQVTAIASTTAGALAAKKETSTVPIVFATGGDPVELALAAVSVDLNLHAVVGRLDMRRQACLQGFVIEIGVQIGQHGPFRVDAFDPAQGVVEAEMAGVRPVPQRVHDPDVEVGKRRQARVGQADEIAGIRETVEPESEGRNVAVVLQEREDHDRAACPLDCDRLARRDPVLVRDRRIFAAGRRHEAVAELMEHDAGRGLIQVEIEALPAMNVKRAQIIDPVGVVGVRVGEEDAVEPIDIGVEQLLAQIGRRVDEHAGAAAVGAGSLD